MTMINYVEKGIGLHRAIENAGLSLWQLDGIWYSSDDVAVQHIIDSYSLADAKATVRTSISEHARHLRDSVVADISPAEMASWAIKRAEAIAYTASGLASDAPMLITEAAARGVALEALVARVQGNAATLAMLEAGIAGTEGKHRDAVTALTTFADVLSYDYSTGWPML